MNQLLLPLASDSRMVKVAGKQRRVDRICKNNSTIYPMVLFLSSLLIGGEIGYHVGTSNSTDNNSDMMFNCLLPDGSQTANADSLTSVEGMNWRMEIINCQDAFNFTSKVQAPLPNAQLYQLMFYMPDVINFAGAYYPVIRCDEGVGPVTTYCARTVNEPYEEDDNGGQFIAQVLRTLSRGALKNGRTNPKKVKIKYARANNNTRKAFARMNGLPKTVKKGR